MRGSLLTLASLLLLSSCSGLVLGHIVKERPSILDDPRVVRMDPNGNGSQVSSFLKAHNAGITAGLCQGMLSEELTPSDWCIVSENGEAYLIVDYTNDAFGVDGFRIQPLRYEGKNRFRNLEGRQLILLEPWTPTQ
jgi:hypothetical protein